MFGEVTGEISLRAQKLATVMAEADMRPFISHQIITWLISHSAFITRLLTRILKSSGTMEAFINNPKIIRETIKSIRESFRICQQAGINPKKEKVNLLYYLSLFISVPIVKKIFSNAAMQVMFDGYLKKQSMK